MARARLHGEDMCGLPMVAAYLPTRDANRDARRLLTNTYAAGIRIRMQNDCGLPVLTYTGNATGSLTRLLVHCQAQALPFRPVAQDAHRLRRWCRVESAARFHDESRRRFHLNGEHTLATFGILTLQAPHRASPVGAGSRVSRDAVPHHSSFVDQGFTVQQFGDSPPALVLGFRVTLDQGQPVYSGGFPLRRTGSAAHDRAVCASRSPGEAGFPACGHAW